MKNKNVISKEGKIISKHIRKQIIFTLKKHLSSITIDK